MSQGLQSVGKGVVGGVSDLFSEPYRGARKSGASGFLRGALRGVVGMVVKPFYGIQDLASKTVQGVGWFTEGDDSIDITDPLQRIHDFLNFQLFNPSSTMKLWSVMHEDLVSPLLAMIPAVPPVRGSCKQGLSCILTDGWAVFDPIEEYKRMGIMDANDLGKKMTRFESHNLFSLTSESKVNLNQEVNEESEASDTEQESQESQDHVPNDVRGWRITRANAAYEMCSTYPRLLVVPDVIDDATLREVARFRARGKKICTFNVIFSFFLINSIVSSLHYIYFREA